MRPAARNLRSYALLTSCESKAAKALRAARARCERERIQCGQACTLLSATVHEMSIALASGSIVTPSMSEDLSSRFQVQSSRVTELSLAVKRTEEDVGQLLEDVLRARERDGSRPPKEQSQDISLCTAKRLCIIPAVLDVYVLRAGDASIAKERIEEFEHEISSRFPDGQAAVAMLREGRMTADEQVKRLVLEEELHSAVQDAARWKARCIAQGLDPDSAKTRRRSSTLTSYVIVPGGQGSSVDSSQSSLEDR